MDDQIATVLADLINSLDATGKHKLISVISESMVMDIEKLSQPESVQEQVAQMFNDKVTKEIKTILLHQLAE